MMTNPGITELDKHVDSRYTLVSMVSKRARMIGEERNLAETNGEEYDAEANSEKPVSKAVGEIVSGSISYVRSDAVENACAYEQDKIEAIANLDNDAE